MSMEIRVRVLVVDDHVILRQGVTRLLNAEPDLEVVGEASEGRAAVALTRQLLPDVVIMDVSMPGMGGVEATRAIHAELPDVRVIGHSVFEEAESGMAMRQAGAVEYVCKMGASTALIAAVRACCPSSRVRESAAATTPAVPTGSPDPGSPLPVGATPGYSARATDAPRRRKQNGRAWLCPDRSSGRPSAA